MGPDLMSQKERIVVIVISVICLWKANQSDDTKYKTSIIYVGSAGRCSCG